MYRIADCVIAGSAAMFMADVAPVPIPSDPSTWIAILERFGPFVLMVAWFMYRDYMRESRMSKAIEQHETYQRTTLEGLIRACTEAIERSSAAIETMAEAEARCRTTATRQPVAT